MTVTSAGQHDPKSKGRSRITNYRDLLPDIDGRSGMARRYRDIVSAIIIDQGGLGRIAEARMQLIRRFAACAVQAEAMDSRMANGEVLDIGEYSTLTSTMVRVAQRIGINRTASDITSLGEILTGRVSDAN